MKKISLKKVAIALSFSLSLIGGASAGIINSAASTTSLTPFEKCVKSCPGSCNFWGMCREAER